MATMKQWAMKANTKYFCNAKVGVGKHGSTIPTCKGLKRNCGDGIVVGWLGQFVFRGKVGHELFVCSTNNVEYEFWSYLDDIRCCVKSSKKKYVVNWPIVPNTWWMKICINLSREEVLALEDARFQLQ